MCRASRGNLCSKEEEQFEQIRRQIGGWREKTLVGCFSIFLKLFCGGRYILEFRCFETEFRNFGSYQKNRSGFRDGLVAESSPRHPLQKRERGGKIVPTYTTLFVPNFCMLSYPCVLAACSHFPPLLEKSTTTKAELQLPKCGFGENYGFASIASKGGTLSKAVYHSRKSGRSLFLKKFSPSSSSFLSFVLSLSFLIDL